jgi:hypothetical protein
MPPCNRLIRVSLAVVVLMGCNAPTLVSELNSASLSLDIHDIVTVDGLTDRNLTVMLTPVDRATCHTLMPDAVATVGGAAVAPAGRGGWGRPNFPEGSSCNQPTWMVDATTLDGGALNFVLSDTSGSLSATFPGAASLRVITPETTALRKGVLTSMSWAPLTDIVTDIHLSLLGSQGVAWEQRPTVNAAGFSFSPEFPDAGVGHLIVDGHGFVAASQCTGLASCTSFLEIARSVTVSYAP